MLRTRRILTLASISMAVIISAAGCANAEPLGGGTSTPVATSLPSPGSRAEGIISCMSDNGYEGAIADDGTLTFQPVPSAQKEEFDEAIAKCGDDNPYVPLNEAQIREMYQRELANKACIEELGFSVGSAPTEQNYIDTYNTADWWFAIAALEGIAGKEMEEIIRKCPPPTFFN